MSGARERSARAGRSGSCRTAGSRPDRRRAPPFASGAPAGSRPSRVDPRSTGSPRRATCARRSGSTPEAGRPCRESGATDDRADGRSRASPARGRTPPARPSGPQLEALDLAGRGLRQLRDEVDPAGVLVRSDLVLHEGLELVGELVTAARRLFEDHERLRLDEPIAVLTAHHRRLQHGGMAHQRRFHLDGRDPDAADLQHVIGASAVPEVAVLVLVILVARLDPCAEERLLGLVVLVPVVRHRGVAFDAQVADLAARDRPALVVDDRELVAGYGQARRAGARPPRAVRDEDVPDLSGANAVDDLHAEPLAPAREELVGQRLAGRYAEPER